MTKSKKNSKKNIDNLDALFGRLPQLSQKWKRKLAKAAPYIALIAGICGILISFTAVGVLGVFSPLADLGGTGVLFQGIASVAAWFIASIMMLLSVVYLFIGREVGWKLFFWGTAILIFVQALSFSITGIIIVIFSLYLITQIRGFYK